MQKQRNCLFKFNAKTLLLSLLTAILLLQYLAYVKIPGPRSQPGQQQEMRQTSMKGLNKPHTLYKQIQGEIAFMLSVS